MAAGRGIDKNKTSGHGKIRIVLLAALFAALCMIMDARPAFALYAPVFDACSCNFCQCEDAVIPGTQDVIDEEYDLTDQLIFDEFLEMERWILNDIWRRYFPELFANMTQQLTIMAFQQTMMLGVMFDAKTQMETQQMMEQMTARAHKDYRPSVSMCFLGTAMRSLAAADRRADTNTAIMSRWAQYRHTGHMNVSAAEGWQADQKHRLEQFRRYYCDTSDNNNGQRLLCPGGAAPAATRNKDIDFARTVDRKLTLDIDLTDSAIFGDEQDVFALASNLYDHSVTARIPEFAFNASINQELVLDARAIAAKRGVAESSFFAIAGIKSLGSPAPLTPMPTNIPGVQPRGNSEDTRGYMALLLQRLGVNAAESLAVLGTRPSYYAQMEMLTKKAYQNPDFYTELYDSPANTARKKVAMQAIGLMQDFDTLSSYLRTEMMLSLVLELEIMKVQEDVEKRILALTSTEN